MRIVVDANLTIVGPPPAVRRRVLQWATFRRRGRLPPRARRWVRCWYADPRRVTIPIGLWDRVQHWPPCAGQPLIDQRFAGPPIDLGWRGRLYPYQAAACRAVLARGGGILVSLPGSGKTIMGVFCATAWRQPVLWLVHTKDLAEQARLRWREATGLPPTALGLVGMGEDTTLTPGIRVYIGMMQTLARRPDLVRLLAQRVGTVIVDEAHHAPADSLRRILVRLPARHKLGLSATIDRTDGLGPMVRALLGPATRIPLPTLLAAGRVVRPHVFRVRTPFRLARAGVSWAALERARAFDPDRTRLILALLQQLQAQGRRVLVLVTRVDHARHLAAAARARGLPAVAVTGVVTPGLRQRMYRATEAGQVILVATRLADEGLDLPRLDTVLLAAAGRSPVRLQQQIGRIMRTAPGKEAAWVFDLVDAHVPVLARQARLRQWTYAQWDLPVRDLGGSDGR